MVEFKQDGSNQPPEIPKLFFRVAVPIDRRIGELLRPTREPSRVIGAGGEYALHEISCDAGRSDRAICIFAGASSRGNRNRCGTWLCRRATGLYVWVLQLLPLRLRALRVLRI